MDRAGISASELAARSGLTDSAISYFRAGRREPSFRSIQALSKALPELAVHLGSRPEAAEAQAEERGFEAIERAIAEFRQGKMLVVLDDEDRENEGDG